MTHEQAFLEAVLAAPDTDAPRLVFADWLDEHGDPDRAAFIRAQCELARQTADSPRRRELAALSRRLLDEHGSRWAEPLRRFVEEWHFQRGFIERVVVSAEALLRDAPALFRLAPIRRFRLTDAGGDIRFLGALPPSASVTGLDLIGNDFQDDLLPALANCPALRRLERLVLCCNLLRDPGAEILCQHSFFGRLRGLQCGGNPISDAGRDQLRGRFGERVRFEYRREDDHLYAFRDRGYGWHAGLASDPLQVFAQEFFPELEVYFFDREGNLVAKEVRTLLEQVPEDRDERCKHWDDAVAAWRQEVGLRPTVIRVKRFETREATLLDLEGQEENFDLWDVWSTVEQDEMRRGLREFWLGRGVFVYTDGNLPFIDKDGEIQGH